MMPGSFFPGSVFAGHQAGGAAERRILVSISRRRARVMGFER